MTYPTGAQRLAQKNCILWRQHNLKHNYIFKKTTTKYGMDWSENAKRNSFVVNAEYWCWICEINKVGRLDPNVYTNFFLILFRNLKLISHKFLCLQCFLLKIMSVSYGGKTKKKTFGKFCTQRNWKLNRTYHMHHMKWVFVTAFVDTLKYSYSFLFYCICVFLILLLVSHLKEKTLTSSFFIFFETFCYSSSPEWTLIIYDYKKKTEEIIICLSQKSVFLFYQSSDCHEFYLYLY